MRRTRSAPLLAALAASALAAAAAAVACGDDDDDAAARNGAGGAAGRAGAAGGRPRSCGGFVRNQNDPCQACVAQNCCDAAEVCLGLGDDCAVCDDDPYGEACLANVDSLAFRKCRLNQCADACQIADAKVDVDAPAETLDTACGDEGFACNPVKVEKCSGADANSCDPDQAIGVCDEGEGVEPGERGFVCYCPPQKRTLGQSCGAADGFCLEGLDCYNWTDTCAKYCCDDGDCSADARCAKEPGALWGKGKVGVCLLRDAF